MYSFGKSFIRTALFIGIIASAVTTSYGRSNVQTGADVIAGGNPPLTREMSDQIREVFEWLLEARFAPTQCEQFQQLLVAEWLNGSGKGNEVFLDFLKLRSQLAEATTEQRNAARAQIQPKFVQALYQPPVDAMSRLLSAVYESKRNKLNQVSSSPPQIAPAYVSNNNSRPTGVPAELVGEWVALRGSGSSYTNPNTGSYSAPNATTDSYKFLADGSYEHAILMTSSLYNCTIRIFGRETGRAAVDGHLLAVTPGTGTLEYNEHLPPVPQLEEEHSDGRQALAMASRARRTGGKVVRARRERQVGLLPPAVKANGSRDSEKKRRANNSVPRRIARYAGASLSC